VTSSTASSHPETARILNGKYTDAPASSSFRCSAFGKQCG